VRVTFSTGIAAGGNLAYWTSYLVTMVFTFITAAVIAEVCSASPSAGSIYLWAAEAGGPRFGRLLGFIVAWWSTTAWTTFCASNTQAAANYMLSVCFFLNHCRIFADIYYRKSPCSTWTSLQTPATSSSVLCNGSVPRSCSLWQLY
jgi:amino acid transporter